MAVAGRVAIVPQGDYDSTKIYKRLDLVYYNGNVYVAKKENVGILPTDTEFWMFSMGAFSGKAGDVGYNNSKSKLSAKNIQDALDEIAQEFIKNESKGVPGGVATLGNDGKVPEEQLPDKIAIGDQTPTFTQASTRANLTSKEKLSISLGKIMKWFADLANGAASTLLGGNLTASRALVSNSSGKVGVSSVTSAELGYLSGTKSNIQSQLDELNTGLNKIGTIVSGKTITTTVPINTGTTIATITLSPGIWIIMANVWTQNMMKMVSLEIKNIMGVTGSLAHPQVCGIVNPTTQKEYEITFTHWEDDIENIIAPYVLAVRIA